MITTTLRLCKFCKVVTAIVAVACTLATLYGQESVKDDHIPGSATLKMRVVYRGEIPKLPPINSASDPVCANLGIPNESLIVGKEGALQNAALIWDERRNAKLKVLDKDEKWRDKVIELKFKDCRIEPHVLVMRAGQEVKIVLLGRTGHNPHFNFFENEVSGLLVPAGQNKTFLVSRSEPAPIPIECIIHPWMKAHLIVKAHPYVGVSDSDGTIEIDNLPPGENIFQLWHEAAAFRKVVHNGVEGALDRGRITFNLDEGPNDLGTIELLASQFKFEPDKK
jgi:plastocyanin